MKPAPQNTTLRQMPPASSFAAEPAGELFALPMPMALAFGLKGTHIGAEQAWIDMPPNAAYTNSRGDVHGGALAVLLDCALASAARAHDPARYGVVTVDLVLHFLASGRGTMHARAQCERRGRSLSFARGEVLDDAGELVAMATGTFKLVERASLSPAP